MYFKLLLFFFCNFFLYGFSANKTENKKKSSRQFVGLINYISGDYAEAVQSGKVKNEQEYLEMKDFIDSAIEIFQNLKFDAANSQKQLKIKANLDSLKKSILNKSKIEKVRYFCELILADTLDLTKISYFPSFTPTFLNGKKKYQTYCQSCHGLLGNGDGPLAREMEPPPRNFHAAEFVEHSSPFKTFNTLKTGIAGTAMISFDGILSDRDMWDISFYTQSLPFDKSFGKVQSKANHTILKAFSISDLSKNSNHELRQKIYLKSQDEQLELSDEHILSVITQLRLVDSFNLDTVLTEKKLDIKGSIADLKMSIDTVEEALFSLKNNEEQLDSLKPLLLDAYLEGFEKVETHLRLYSPNLVVEIEGLFLQVRADLRYNKKDRLEKNLKILKTKLNEAFVVLSQPKDLDYSKNWIFSEFFAAFTIILREGLEAILVIAALLSIVSTMGIVHARIWIHLGWIFALLAGFLTYYFFILILNISGYAREALEAFSTAIAVIILFYTSFWLLNEAERQSWSSYLKKQASKAVDKKSLWFLFFLSFISVYREAAETVLFYNGLIATASNPYMILIGFLSGLIFVLTLGWCILKFNMRLPLKSFFYTTSCLMFILSIILAGKATFEFIEGGFLSYTPLFDLHSISFLGFYPCLETLFAQIFLIMLATTLVLFFKFNQIKLKISSLI